MFGDDDLKFKTNIDVARRFQDTPRTVKIVVYKNKQTDINELFSFAYNLEKQKFLEIYRNNDENWAYTSDGKTYLAIPILQSDNDYLYIKEIQMSGKKRMDIESFLRGFARYFDEYHYISVYDNKID